MNKIAFAVALMVAVPLMAYNFWSVADGNSDTLYVDDDFNAATPGWNETHFSSIGDALNAANGEIIVVFEGVYSEDVVINKSVILTGRNMPIIHGHVVMNANNSSISNFEIEGSNGDGIMLNASLCTVEHCFINGFGTGINISGRNNTISRCNFENNSIGIFSTGISNHIYMNNFINNTQNACDSGTNIWYDDGNQMGNYWSDFDSLAEGAVDGNSDGIADSPYNIPCGANQDIYPLMEKVDVFLPAADLNVDGTAGNNGWFVSIVNVTIQGMDNESMIDYINYSIDGTWYRNESNPCSFSLTDGEHMIEYYAVDEAGNKGRIEVAYINVDTASPSLSYSLNPSQPDGENGWYSGNVEISLNASDGTSGIDEITYNIGGVWEDYTGFFTLTTDGIYDIIFRVVDRAGNEMMKNATIKLDKTPPSIDIIEPSGGFIKGNYEVKWNVTDEIDSDFDGNISIFYMYNDSDGNWQEVEMASGINDTGNFSWASSLFPDAKEAKIKVVAVDDAGNVGEGFSPIFTLDNHPPQITITQPVAGKAYGKDEYGNIIIEVEWEAYDSIDDDLDGTIKIEYFDGAFWNVMVDNYNNNGRYTFNAKDWNDGNYRIRISAIDDAGNKGTATSGNFTIDKKPPSIYISRPLQGYIYINIFGRNIIPPIPLLLPVYDAIIIGKITVEATASDAHSGVQRVEFEADGNGKPDYDAPYEWNWDPTIGVHTLKVTAYDNAGNSAYKEMEKILCINL